MRLAQVVLDIQTKALDSAYSYEITDGMDVAVGCSVVVSFKGRYAIGFVIGICEDEPDFNVLPLSGVVSKPYFNELGAKTALYMQKKYVAPLSACIRLFIPTGSVPKVRASSDGGWELIEASVGEVESKWIRKGPNFESFKPRKSAIRQIEILDAIRLSDMKLSELNSMFPGVSGSVKSLVDQGAIVVESRREIRGGFGAVDPCGRYTARKEVNLNSHQVRAVEAIERARMAKEGRVVLVDGVTGSGKTEVYLKAIENTLAEEKSAIVLVPEISLTPQTVARFRSRFPDSVGVLHSRMSQGERYDQWDLIKSGKVKVVVGARSALFAPLENIGLVVIDEEHESTYKQESAPRYVTRDVAEWMMTQSGGALVLGSATPSIEAMYYANTSPRWDTVEIFERVNKRPLPDIEIVDMTTQSGKDLIFSRQLETSLKKELDSDHKVVLLLNQRGFAKFLLCRDCGFVPQCRFCSTTLTYHERGNRLVCHHCGQSIAAPPVCPSCSSPYLKRYGVGTQRVESELRSILFSDAPKAFDVDLVNSSSDFSSDMSDFRGYSDVEIIRMDADTTSTKGAHEALLDKFASCKRAVLLGTQMIAKGLDFDDVTLVGVINADTQLHLPDFRSTERTFNLIEQVAGRAGRAQLPGKVIVQTYEAENVAIKAAACYDRDMFLRSELPKRKMLGFPPYVHMANILVWGKNGEEVKREIESIHAVFRDRLSKLEVSGWEITDAVPCVFEKIRNDFRWHFVLKCGIGEDLSDFIYKTIGKRQSNRYVNVAIDIDPTDLL